MSEEEANVCPLCGERVIWIRSHRGKNMMCNEGRLTTVSETGSISTGYQPHWMTCKKAKSKKNRYGVEKPEPQIRDESLFDEPEVDDA